MKFTIQIIPLGLAIITWNFLFKSESKIGKVLKQIPAFQDAQKEFATEFVKEGLKVSALYLTILQIQKSIRR